MKKMKKIISIICILSISILCFSGCGLLGGDDTEEKDDNNTPEYYYENDELVKPAQDELFRYKVFDHYVSISEYIGEESNVKIPDSFENKPIMVINANAFENNKTLSTLVVPDTVYYIEEYAFSGCSFLKTVTLSKNLKEISDNCFAYCDLLTDIKLPDKLESIASSAFSYCNSFEEIVIPSSVSHIGGSAFSNCENLKKVVIEDGVIGDEESNYIETVKKSLSSGIFSGDEKLETVLVPDTVVEIDSSSFSGINENVYIYGYVPSQISNFCAENKLNFVEVKEGDDKDRQMKDRSIIVPETKTETESE